MRRPNPKLTLFLIACVLWALPAASSAFCGFYVAKADTKLFNKASKVAIVRDGDRTVLTMANMHTTSRLQTSKRIIAV